MSGPLLALPPELLIAILSNLSLSDLVRVRAVCSALKTLFETNEAAIFHAAAILHGYTNSDDHLDTPLSNIASFKGKRIMKDVSTWYTFCKRCYLINKAWSGKVSANQTVYPASGTSVVRFKVDERRGFLLCTSKNGGVVVSDIENPSTALWSLSSTYVRQWAHIEYENGFLVFDREGDVKEVWRHIPDSISDDWKVERRAEPDEDQLAAEVWPREETDNPQQDRRGHFRPYCLLRPPPHFRGRLNAYHLVYPFVISAGTRAAFIWDVRTGEISQEINFIQTLAGENGPILTLNPVTYVEFSDRYAFIARMQGIQVFTRRHETRGDGILALQMPTCKRFYGRRYYQMLSSSLGRTTDDHPPDPDLQRIARESKMAMIPQTVTVEYHQPEDELQIVFDSPIAVHVTPDGKHLFILLSKPHLVVIPFWEQAILGPNPIAHRHTEANSSVILENILLFGNCAHTIRLGSFATYSRYLAIESQPSTDGKVRVAVATTGGIFVLNIQMPDSYDSISRDEGVNLEMDICLAGSHLLGLPNHPQLVDVSCLQVSPSGVWVNFPPKLQDEDVDNIDDDEEEDDIQLAGIPALSTYYSTLEDRPAFQEIQSPALDNGPTMHRVDLEDPDIAFTPTARTIWSVDF